MIPETIGALIRAQGELGKRGFLVVGDSADGGGRGGSVTGLGAGWGLR